MRLILKTVDGACFVGAVLAALSAGALALMLIGEVIFTSFFAWSQPWSVEYATYLQAFILFLGSGWALRNGGHIRVAILLQLAPKPVARLVDLIATTFGLGVIGYAASALVWQAVRTVNFGSTSFYPMGTPLWIPQALLAAGFVLLALAFAARLFRLITRELVEVPAGHGSGSGVD